MALIENFRDAAGERVQPYFAAYMIEMGYRTIKEAFAIDGSGAPYMAWNRIRWDEFCAPRKIVSHVRRAHVAEFTAWLDRRVIDHAARNHVEAA